MIAYVASALPLRARARTVAAELREAGIRVVSSWHAQSTATVEAERKLTDPERYEIAEQCRSEIRQCDALVIILGPPTTRHGSFCEAELARHLGKRVVALRPYGASEERGVFLAGVPEARNVDGLLRVMCGGPARWLDHLCRNRACVNPDHLEPVTQKVNNLRSESASAKHARQTHCRLGHAFTAENTYVAKRAGGREERFCRECCRERDRVRYARKVGRRETA